jgi:hypothetical protein
VAVPFLNPFFIVFLLLARNPDTVYSPLLRRSTPMIRRPLWLVALAAAGSVALVAGGCGSTAPNPVPSALAFVTQPAGAMGGVRFVTPPRVQVQDASGRPVSDANAIITIAIGSNPGAATLSGTLTVTASGGVATTIS